MKDQSGTIGDRECDGWVAWTTNDHGNSYLPAIHCGAFELVIGKGTDWGAKSEAHGVVFLAIYGATDDDGEPTNEDEVPFVWCQDGFAAAIVDALDSAKDADLEHPVPANVVEAARELWTALMFRDAERGEPIPPSPYADCMTKVDHDRHMRNNRGSEPASDLVTMKVR